MYSRNWNVCALNGVKCVVQTKRVNDVKQKERKSVKILGWHTLAALESSFIYYIIWKEKYRHSNKTCVCKPIQDVFKGKNQCWANHVVRYSLNLLWFCRTEEEHYAVTDLR